MQTRSRSRSTALARETTFPDVLFKVPELSSKHLLLQWPTTGAAIKILRLVCRDTALHSLRFITSCSVPLGGRHPYPWQLARFNDRVHLKKLALSMTASPDGTFMKLLKLDGSCTFQLDDLLSTLSSAILSITSLSLCVTLVSMANIWAHEPIEEYRRRAEIRSIGDTESSTDVASATREMCTGLVPALPNLQHLSLSHQCCDVALATFGALCPKLNSLRVEAVAVSLTALEDLGRALPNLSNLTFQLSQGVNTPQGVESYLDKLFPLLQACSKLVSLSLDMVLKAEASTAGVNVLSIFTITCRPHVWNKLPPSLVNLRCNQRVDALFTAKSLLGRLRSLILMEFPDDCNSLPELLEWAKRLDKLTILNSGDVQLMRAAKPSLAQHLQYKTRLLGGFQLSCPSVILSGNYPASSQYIQDVMTWVSPLLRTTDCTIQCAKDEIAPRYLGQISCMCPRLEFLNLQEAGDSETPSMKMGEAFLGGLAGMASLQRLDVYLAVKFTHEGLVRLCMGLPRLNCVGCYPVKHLNCFSVKEELAEQGRQVTIIKFEE